MLRDETFARAYETLGYVKDNRCKYYDKARKLIRFINTSITYPDSVSTKASINREQLYRTFIEGEKGIISKFYYMMDDASDKFIDRFFDAIDVYIDLASDMLNSGINKDNDFKITLYLINIYTMLRAYEKHKDNYQEFESIVDDVKDLIIDYDGVMFQYYAHDKIEGLPDLEERKNLINALTATKYYKEVPGLRKCLQQVLKDTCCNYDGDLLSQHLRMVIMMKNISSYVEEHESRSNISNETLLNILNYIADNSINAVAAGVKNASVQKRAGDIEVYAPTILAQNNRFEYVLRNLYKIESNPNLRQDIMKQVGKMDLGLFDYLNDQKIKNGNEPTQDEFIRCMSMVFDSDTYYEMKSKLDVLTKASELYSYIIFNAEMRTQALELMNTFESTKHQEEILGKALAYPKDGQNLKPKTIFERMINVYRPYIGKPKFFDYAREVHQEANSISDINRSLFNDFLCEIYQRSPQDENNEKRPIVKQIFSGFGKKNPNN